jgi:hypothetical protein
MEYCTTYLAQPKEPSQPHTIDRLNHIKTRPTQTIRFHPMRSQFYQNESEEF